MRRGDLTAVTSKIGEPKVIGHDHEHMRLGCRGLQGQRQPKQQHERQARQ